MIVMYFHIWSTGGNEVSLLLLVFNYVLFDKRSQILEAEDQKAVRGRQLLMSIYVVLLQL